MKLRILIFGLAAITTGLCANAQSPLTLQRKCDGLVRRQIAANGELVSVIIKCADSQALADTIVADGHRATAVTATLVTARVPASYIPRLARSGNVQYFQAPRQAYSFMSEARPSTGADKVQNGENLDCPYTGKGVIIGVIDQGFEYRHIAFMDSVNRPRVVAVWNRKGYADGTDADPTTDIPSNGDGINVEGHATHVTNIAAGSKIAENNYYGMAPEADIIMVPSTFDESEIMEDVKYIRDFAAAKGEPWVINMSFGAQIGAHDGKSYYSQFLDEMLAEKPGRQIVVAAGNDGWYNQHATFTLKSDADTVRTLVTKGYYGAYVDIWSQRADSLHHLNVRPFIYSDGTRDYRDSTFWAANVFTHQIAPFNNKENYDIALGTSDLQYAQLGLEFTGDKGTTVHAWTTLNHGDFASGPDTSYVKGDNSYCINDIGGCTNGTVTVAAYVTSLSYPTPSGEADATGYGNLNDIAAFSDKGPSLSDVCKPTVTAPGSMIKSAVSKYGVGFDKSGESIVQDVHRGIKHFYYGAMAGTSMATPAVTGIIALWLQANPNLTSKQILEIIHATSKKDEYTGSDDWNPSWGYGKIDAYAGLKAALRLADHTGIAADYNTAHPVSLCRNADGFRILFNSYEKTAHIAVLTPDGRTLTDRRYQNLQCGDELTIPFSTFGPGIYMLHIATAGSQTVRKFVVGR